MRPANEKRRHIVTSSLIGGGIRKMIPAYEIEFHVNTNLTVGGFSSVRVLTPSSAPQPCSAYATPGRDLAMRPEGIIRAPASWRLAALVDWGPCVDCQVPVERTTNMDDLGGGYWSFRLLPPFDNFSIKCIFVFSKVPLRSFWTWSHSFDRCPAAELRWHQYNMNAIFSM